MKSFILLLIFSFTLPSLSQAGQVFVAGSGELTAEVDAAERMLPPKMIQTLLQKLAGQKIQVLIGENLGEHGAGYANLKKQKIVISRKILADSSQLRKSLIHEMSHIYDFLNVHTEAVQAKIAYCKAWPDHAREFKLRDCSLYGQTVTTVSTMPDFLEMAGWYQIPLQFARRQEQTDFTLRSPFKYESTSPGEMFAVNMELFLTDSEFSCRRPGMARYLSQHFDYVPFSTQSCQSGLYLIDASFQKADKSIFNIDPARVYAIHYLLAEKGSAMMSSWGHSMYRVVICAPERKEVGPECMKDLGSHIVFSFRASILGIQLSTVMGLSGQYKSRLFFAPFLQVVDEYTKKEMRDLKSYPLQLSQQEIQSFLQRAIELHWSYDGRYYFITNNCAIESMNLLKGSTLRDSLLDAQVQTPYQLREVLLKAGLTSEEYFVDEKLAVQKDYLYKSFRGNYQSALKVINETLSATFKLEEWMELNAEKRHELVIKAHGVVGVRFYAALLLLERVVETQYTAKLYNVVLGEELKKALSNGKNLGDYKISQNATKSDLTNPGAWFSAGYGIPTATEIVDLKKHLESLNEKRLASIQEMNEYYQSKINPAQLQELEAIQAIAKFFTEKIRSPR